MTKNYAKIILINLVSIGISTSLYTQTTITLRPNAIDGKDATLWDLEPNDQHGDCPDFAAIAGTNGGTPSHIRSLIKFDLTVIPSGALITSALLSLYSYDSPLNGHHNTIDGSNACELKRVTSYWDEHTVTWNTEPATTNQNMVILPQSTDSIQDYLDINVTQLVLDMLLNPGSSYGFSLKLITEQHYRAMIFASSDNPDPNLHPKLEITYTDSDTVQPPPKCIIDVPTAFSPNGDGQNDKLYVRGSDFKNFEFRLFNRWGEQIFSTKDINKAWDGTYKGVQQESEVYFYILKANCINGDKVEKRGNITLLY